MAREDRWMGEGLYLLPHRLNYFTPLSYTERPNMDVYPPGTEPLSHFETKFQLSVKIPAAQHLFNYDVRTYLAYTQVSFWQAYNQSDSSIFRNTDYEPEIFLQFPSAKDFGVISNRCNRLGYAHQSNGQGGSLSRSWNRLYAEFVFDTARTFFSIKPWYRLQGPADKDTNPDMWKYLGYGEIRGAMKFRSQNELSLLFRNNLRIPDNKGAIELGWSFPLPIIKSMKGYVQYFNGYGESLLDYNYPVSRVSAGLSFSDWL